ncbi:hypothetical protein [Paenibacillus lactis]|uniref:hypothetical protein n=1 Tax=Paenibacillus lactis TaxID=228574 RepID=UPI001B0EAF9D|nr:hypothetical protein [Paenibacillus lactis]GIO93192.1 hypothetical protein J31TS3_44190 [Paenibacillus lactis]
MAEAINYRMNLVIDPKNAIKANRELRAMERYFERIQGRGLRIGRTRMAPEIVLKDRASKGLDNLLAKINRVKSQVINASGNVNMNVNVKHSAKPLNFDPLVKALKENTVALKGLADALAKLQLGGGGGAQKPKSKLDHAIDMFGAMKTFGGGAKSVGELRDKTKRVGDAWLGNDTKANKDSSNSESSYPKESRVERGRRQRKGRGFRTIAAAGDLIETVGNAGTGILGGARDFWKSGSALFGGGSGGGGSSAPATSGISAGSSAAAQAVANPGSKAAATPADKIADTGSTGSGAVKGTDNGAASQAAKAADPKVAASKVSAGAAPSKLASGFLKGAGKRILGPLGFLADVNDIAAAKPGKERNQAIGSAVGGGIGATIGGAIGSVIPVAGTLVGSTVGGAVGSFVGEKIGGAINGITKTFKSGGDKVSKWFSNTFSFGKKKKDVVAEAKPAPKPAAPAVSAPSAMIANPAPAIPAGPATPRPPSAPVLPYSGSSFGPPAIDPARSQAYAAGKQMTPQMVQISPEQMSALTGYLRDSKTEATTNYNLPPGAVQVTVREEHPVDVEGLILQVGQRLRAELMKASQNRKPAAPMPY